MAKTILQEEQQKAKSVSEELKRTSAEHSRVMSEVSASSKELIAQLNDAEHTLMETDARSNELQLQLEASQSDYRHQMAERFDHETKLKTENSLLKERNETNKATLDGYRKQFEIIDQLPTAERFTSSAQEPWRSIQRIAGALHPDRLRLQRIRLF